MSPSLPALTTEGQNKFAFAAWIFLRLLALIHLIAFVSFWTQLEGLIGPRGLLPADAYFSAVREHFGGTAFRQLPSLCWWFGTGTFLHVLCAAGVALSLLLFAGVAPALCLALLWASYLSLNCAGQIFFNFQWDALLLETTLLAVFLAPWRLFAPRGGPGALSSSTGIWRPQEPPLLARLLLWWLLFRLMFFAGVVKLASGDALWKDLTALAVHYETQPLPTPLAWYSHQLPLWWHRAACAGMFALELLVPFFLFAPRALRHNAALLLSAFMVAVALTGNYTFFNLLAIALCLLCLDDAWWHQVLPARTRARFHVIRENARPPFSWRRPVGMVAAAGVLAYTVAQELPVVFPKLGAPPGYARVTSLVGPFRSFNNYGLFAVMTNPRLELVFEGSDDRREWRPYEFPHKPGALTRRPSWVAPHQPRLDWQLWFAALGRPEHNRWVLQLCEHILRGTPEVFALLAENPFPAQPPRHIRVVRYEYHFTDPEVRARTGQWWRRTPVDLYVPPSSLK